MFDKKLKVEKVEMVKKIVRDNNYDDYAKAHQQCIELGINVNRPALDKFGKKLKKLDTAPRPQLNPNAPSLNHVANGSNVEYIDTAKARRGEMGLAYDLDSLSNEAAKERESAITYELGELKIREHRLLQELALISEKFKLN